MHLHWVQGVKLYKSWEPVMRKEFYSIYVIFREVKETSRDELEKKEIEMTEESLDLGELVESNKEMEQ